MPKTKFQHLVFASIMVLVMVYFMTLYNMAWSNAVNQYVFINPLFVMWPEVATAFIIQKYIGGPLSDKIFIRINRKTKKRQLPKSFLKSVSTVLIMAPCMTLCVSIMRNGISLNLPIQWIDCLLRNFLFALCLQIFLAGPIVRFTFRLIFKKRKERLANI